MEIHSSVLARRTPWTEDTGGDSAWDSKESDTPGATFNIHWGFIFNGQKLSL